MKKTDNYKIHLLRIHLDFFFILKLNYQLNYLCPITKFYSTYYPQEKI